jgi:hypothetical protein
MSTEPDGIGPRLTKTGPHSLCRDPTQIGLQGIGIGSWQVLILAQRIRPTVPGASLPRKISNISFGRVERCFGAVSEQRLGKRGFAAFQ